MMYLNGEISQVYFNGYYHGDAYFGNTLVWSGLKKMPVEANGMIALTNSSDGVVILFIPGESNSALKIDNTAKADLWSMIENSGNSEVKVENSTEPDLISMTEDSGASSLFIESSASSEIIDAKNKIPRLSSMLINSQANGYDVVINKDDIKEDLIIDTQKVITHPLNLNLIIGRQDFALSASAPIHRLDLNTVRFNQDLNLDTSIPDGDDVRLNPIAMNQEVNWTTAIPDCDGVTLNPIVIAKEVSSEQSSADSSIIMLKDIIVDSGEKISSDGIGDRGTGESNTLEKSELGITLIPELAALNVTNVLVEDNCIITNIADANAYPIWEYPVRESDGVLKITQAYSLLRIDDTVEIDKGLKKYTVVDTIANYFDLAIIKGPYDPDKKSWGGNSEMWKSNICNYSMLYGRANSQKEQPPSDIEAILINNTSKSHVLKLELNGSLWDNKTGNTDYERYGYVKINDKVVVSGDSNDGGYVNFERDNTKWVGFIPSGGAVRIQIHAAKTPRNTTSLSSTYASIYITTY